jgi:capsular exopolysaccharide synthesis family protein
VDPLEYLRAIRRRWVIPVAAVLLAVVIAWATTTVAPASTKSPTRLYEATTILLSRGGGSPGFTNLQTLAALTTIPDVAKRVADTMHYTGDPQVLARQVRAFGDSQTGLLNITADSTDPKQAQTLADTFATELLGFLAEQAGTTAATEAAAIKKRLDSINNDINNLNTQIATASPGQAEILKADRDAKLQTYTALQQTYQNLLAQAGNTVTGLLIIQSAVPSQLPTSTTAGFQPPKSRMSRVLLGAIVGLLLGIALALVLERFDTRIRNKKAAEKHFGLPVLAEIPLVPRLNRWRPAGFLPLRRSAGVPVVMPAFPRVGDAFRLLGAGVSRSGLSNGNGHGGLGGNGHQLGQRPTGVILVTSPGPEEGKTTVVANLALTFVQTRRRVIVLSCDFQHPKIHHLFAVPNTDGLADALASRSSTGGVLNGHIKTTPVRDVRLVPSGVRPQNAAGLFSSDRMQEAVAEARREADIVLIDTPPLLTSAEVAHLFPLVDAVLVVARAKKTTQELAERAGEMLKRLDAPVVGVALNGATEVPLPGGHAKYWEVVGDQKE